MLMMGAVYYKDATGTDKNTVPVYIDTLVKASGQVGTLIGQIVFGILFLLMILTSIDNKNFFFL
jgi:MFS transporter, PHS family, inorganic phosphate transporter